MRMTPENEDRAEKAASDIREGLLLLLRENMIPAVNEIEAVTYFAKKAEDHLRESDPEGHYENDRHRAAVDLAAAYAALAKATARALAFTIDIGDE